MQEERAEIHVDRTDHRRIIVGHDGFRVQKARSVLINLHTRSVQLLIVRTCDHVHQLFIRDARRQDAHVHAGLRRNGQRRNHLVIQYKIRRGDIDVLSRVMDDLQVGGFTDIDVVER